ncbi:MAG: LON peptidase substrate-binding domain-containing protein [Verrucomicrobia bacterium]|nr:LON peptidase substrate-binding domain-containing protein [Verrucomicrobiota bacterium]MDA1067788.1 LON peptidase substrate-binding domain-containing protein [Verrucomicrobiota bacterium]
MKLEIELPSRIPVMTLPEVAFFPKVMMPLFIFEPRYRRMLQSSLKGHRMFAVAGLDKSKIEFAVEREPAHKIATLGIIRGCRTQQDGTSQLILHGLARIRLDEIYDEKPYREAEITPLESTQKIEKSELLKKQSQLLTLVKQLAQSNDQFPIDLLKFMESLEDPENFVDMVAYSMISDAELKQSVLNTLVVEDRFDLLIDAFGEFRSN